MLSSSLLYNLSGEPTE